MELDFFEIVSALPMARRALPTNLLPHRPADVRSA